MEQYEIVEKLISLYCYQQSEQRFMYIKNDGSVEYKDPHREITYADLFDHLDGKRTLSVYGRKYHTAFMTLDVDENSPDSVRLIINKMEETGIQRNRIYVSLSGNKGYHIDVFFDDGVFKNAIKNYYANLCRDRAIGAINFECFPIGHTAVKIPLGVNLKTGNRCWYVDRETLEPIENFDYISEITPMSAKEFEQIVYTMNKRSRTEDILIAKENAKSGYVRKNIPNKNGPVLTAVGQRHNLMCKLSVYLRKSGADEETIRDELMAWVSRQNPNLIRSSIEEIEKDAASIAKSAVRKYEPDVFEHSKPEAECVGAGEIYLTPEDIKMILKATTKNNRKVAFLICVYCRKYGSCLLSYKQIEGKIGASDMAAYRAIKQLTELGIIKTKSCGGMVRSCGKPVLRRNEYCFNFTEGTRKYWYHFSDIDNFDEFYRRVMREVRDED